MSLYIKFINQKQINSETFTSPKTDLISKFIWKDKDQQEQRLIELNI